MTTLDIVSDPICPWCYIGKAKLDRAFGEELHSRVEVNWRVFQLNPDMPEEGMDRETYLSNKFGGPEGARAFYAKIEEAAERAGLNVNFDRISRTPNTVDAHRLIRWSRSTGEQHALVESLFRAYFTDGEDIGDRDVLINIGTGHGLERPLLEHLYEEDADRALILNEDALSRQMGVDGVPCYILAEKYALVGAQETETWRDVIERLQDVEPGQALG